MITVVGIMTIGILLGILIRKKQVLVRINDKLTTWSIYLLLLLIGISIGSNKTIVDNLHTLGIQAFLITLGGVIGSIILAWITFRLFFKNRRNHEE